MNAIARALAAVVCSLAVIANGQTPAADRISLHVAVDGVVNAPLTADDFEVAIDGRPVATKEVSPPPSPLTLIVLLDKTRSMQTYGEIDEVVEKSIVSVLHPGDRMRVGGIASRLSLAAAFSANPREIIAAGRNALSFKNEERSGPSPIWDAIDQAVSVLEPEPGLRALVVVTDGRGTGNRIGFVPVGDRAVSSGVVMYVLSEALPVILRQDESTAARIRPGVALAEIARATGGMVLPADPAPTSELPPAGIAFARFMADLHGMYTLTIPADGVAGSVHRVDVKVKRAGLAARTRRAYRTR